MKVATVLHIINGQVTSVILKILQMSITISRIYWITGHGKDELDHVGDLAKVTTRGDIAAGNLFSDSEKMMDWLNLKFQEK